MSNAKSASTKKNEVDLLGNWGRKDGVSFEILRYKWWPPNRSVVRLSGTVRGFRVIDNDGLPPIRGSREAGLPSVTVKSWESIPASSSFPTPDREPVADTETPQQSHHELSDCLPLARGIPQAQESFSSRICCVEAKHPRPFGLQVLQLSEAHLLSLSLYPYPSTSLSLSIYLSLSLPLFFSLAVRRSLSKPTGTWNLDSGWLRRFLGHMMHSLRIRVLPPYVPSEVGLEAAPTWTPKVTWI